MAWIELHDTLPDHPKTRKVARQLDVPIVQIVGHLVCLFGWVVRFKPGGVLRGLTKDDIAEASHWGGKAEPFVKALTDHGFLDKAGGRDKALKVHDWETYTKGYRKAVADRERKRRNRGGGKSKDSPGTGAVTGPDLTGPDLTDQTGTASAPKSGTVATEIASKYCQMNRGMLSQQKATDDVARRIRLGMDSKTALARVMNPEMCRDQKLWDVLDPITPNGKKVPETMSERRLRMGPPKNPETGRPYDE